MFNKVTQSENLVIQGLVSILVSALIAALSAVAQYVTRGGHIDIGVALSVAVAAFSLAFGQSLKTYVPAHPKDTIQALSDAKAQAEAEAKLWQDRAYAVQAQQQSLPETVASKVAQKISDNVQQIVASSIPVAAPTESAVNPLAGTDFASLMAPTNPNLRVVSTDGKAA